MDTACSLRENLDVPAYGSDVTTSTSGRGSQRMSMECLLIDHWSVHGGQSMNPDLWSTLPRELLHCISARLPLPQIIRLRCISKERMRTITESDSGAEFRRSHAEANPKIFGLVYQNWTTTTTRSGWRCAMSGPTNGSSSPKTRPTRSTHS